jgi:hypothetical protein
LTEIHCVAHEGAERDRDRQRERQREGDYITKLEYKQYLCLRGYLLLSVEDIKPKRFLSPVTLFRVLNILLAVEIQVIKNQTQILAYVGKL